MKPEKWASAEDLYVIDYDRFVKKKKSKWYLAVGISTFILGLLFI